MMTQTRSTFAAPQERPAPRTESGGRGNGGMIILTAVSSDDDNEAGAAAVRMAQLITMRHRIDSLLNVTDQCNVTLPSTSEYGTATQVTLHLQEGGAM